METPKLLKKYIQMILTQQYGITPDKLKTLTNNSQKKTIAELLTTQGLLTKNQIFQVVKEAKQKVTEFKASNKLNPEMLPTKQLPPLVSDSTEKVLSREVSPLKRIGKYEIVKKIAQGGMGAVYQARHLELDQIYALKLILEGEHATPDTIARFHREAKISAKLKHPGIVSVVDSGEEGGQHYFVMEYI
ncbi:MAG: protein kinase, partial [Planctomycetota bacterium]